MECRPNVSLKAHFAITLALICVIFSYYVKAECSRNCVVQHCDLFSIRYGKYCGVGWSGCPDEQPCDDVDACCKIHDECTAMHGVTNVKCHKKFKRCINAELRSGKVGFSPECPYERAVATMSKGMDSTIFLSNIGGGFMKGIFG